MQIARNRVPGDGWGYLQALAWLLLGGLLLLGVGGSLYKLAAPEGWAAQLFGRSLAGGIATVLTLVMIGTCFWLTREFVSARQRSQFSGLMGYVFAGAGALYVVQFYLNGGI